MIHAFLKSISAQVRVRVADRSSVHVTEETAQELDLLAGLPWSDMAKCACEPDADPEEPGETKTHYLRICAACGTKWEGLHCPHDGFQNPCPGCGRRPIVLREPQPADIALGWLLASKARVIYESCHECGDWDFSGAPPLAIDRAAVCAELAVIAANHMQGSLVVGYQSANPYLGTREGARTAWGFICAELMKIAAALPGPTRQSGKTSGQELLLPIIATYCRELEGMKK